MGEIFPSGMCYGISSMYPWQRLFALVNKCRVYRLDEVRQNRLPRPGFGERDEGVGDLGVVDVGGKINGPGWEIFSTVRSPSFFVDEGVQFFAASREIGERLWG